MQVTNHPAVAHVASVVNSWRGMPSLHTKFPTEESVVDFAIRDYWHQSPETRAEFGSESVFGSYVRGARRRMDTAASAATDPAIDTIVAAIVGRGADAAAIECAVTAAWDESATVRDAFLTKEGFAAYCRHHARASGTRR